MVDSALEHSLDRKPSKNILSPHDERLFLDEICGLIDETANKLIYTTFFSLTDSVEDLCQTVKLKVLEELSKRAEWLSELDDWKPYVWRMVKNTLVDALREQSKFTLAPIPDDDPTVSELEEYQDYVPVPSHTDAGSYDHHCLIDLDLEVRNLPQSEKEAMIFFLEGYSYKEMGQKTGKQQGALRAAKHRALKKLKRSLAA